MYAPTSPIYRAAPSAHSHASRLYINALWDDAARHILVALCAIATSRSNVAAARRANVTTARRANISAVRRSSFAAAHRANVATARRVSVASARRANVER